MAFLWPHSPLLSAKWMTDCNTKSSWASSLVSTHDELLYGYLHCHASCDSIIIIIKIVKKGRERNYWAVPAGRGFMCSHRENLLSRGVKWRLKLNFHRQLEASTPHCNVSSRRYMFYVRLNGTLGMIVYWDSAHNASFNCSEAWYGWPWLREFLNLFNLKLKSVENFSI